MTKNEKLVAYIEATEKGYKSFIEYEDEQYPDGDTPFADMHRDVYIAGYVAHWRESIQEIERYVE